jgi:uncharacterized repeat protein (TIGR01451 family)
MKQRRLWTLIAGPGLAAVSLLLVFLLLGRSTAGATPGSSNQADSASLVTEHSVSGSDTGTHATASASPWTVFTPVHTMSDNLLTNPGFEEGSEVTATGWYSFVLDSQIYTYTVDPTGGRGGGRALKLVDDMITDTHYGGARQVITLDPPITRSLYFSGYSKAECVSGNPDANYSVYLDLQYADGTPLWAQVLQFDTCSQDWQFREGYIIPAKPVQTITVHCLLRWTHRGTVWFDDLSVREVQSELVFDSVPVTTTPPSSPPYGGPPLPLATDDGLALTLTTDGGVVTGVTLGGTPVHDPDRAYASGFFVRDVAGKSDFVHVGGSLVAQTEDVIIHTGTITGLDLDLNATYTATADRITIHAEVADTSVSTRALTLYFALPISATEDWTWGDDIRTSQTISGMLEFANFSSEHQGIGANGYLSKYPWASLSGPRGGIALGVPLDSPRAMRLIHNPITNQFYVAFDLGLYPSKFVYLPLVMRNGGSYHQIGSTRRFLPPYEGHTPRFPSRGSVDLVLYRFDDEWRYDDAWGFRAATQGYHDRFTETFTRRIPCEREGIWVAFSDLEPITDVEDFGIAFHELDSLDQVPFDDEHGIFSFRYLAEPWSQWLPINRRPLTNPGFEDGPPDSAPPWEKYDLGYTVVPTGGCCGSRALKLVNDTATATYGAVQTIHLTQTISRPLYFSGWSKALTVTGETNEDYSIYLDVFTLTWISKRVLPFGTGTHDWQFREGFVIPDHPIDHIKLHCLLRENHSGTAWFDNLDLWEVRSETHGVVPTMNEVAATVRSGFLDECNRYRYESSVQPWCSGPAGCAVFTVNPDPDISVPPYRINKAHLEWNQAKKDAYTTTPGLDGEYIDSFLSHATVMDYRTAHFAAADIPLTYGTSDRRVGVPEVFATVEFARWVAQDVHEDLGKWMMANWILRDLPWGADLFDVMGTETNWLIHDGTEPEDGFVPERDATLSYRRTLAYQRPYGLLMNTNFITPTDDLPYTLTHELVERYFQVALFYGFYPSMFSHNAAEDPYWTDPALYNRDRDLFKRYIPLIRRLNCAGWQPVTYAATDSDSVYIERFGDWPDLHFTLRNTTEVTIPVTVTLWADDDDALGLPKIPLVATALLAGTQHPLSRTGDIRTLTMTLGGQASEILNLAPDVEIHKSSQPPTLKVGDALTYTLVYRNNGPCKVAGVVITDIVPVALTNASYTYTGGIITPTGDISYTWQVENLTPGEGGVITIAGIVSPSLGGPFTLINTATITAADFGCTDGHPSDQHLYNNVSVVRTVAP